MHHLDLFSGIGGFRLALDLCRIPIEHSYHSEIEDYANQVYAKNYPDSIALGDIRAIDGRHLRERHTGPWIITGGFPCQDISYSGKRKGLTGERSGLWFEMLRIIEELRPELVLIENVAALKNRGLIDVLRGLDGAGFDAEWNTVSALEVGAIHTRKRLWITAHPRHSDSDANGAINQQLAKHPLRDLGEVQQPDSPTHTPLSAPEWQATEAAGSFHAESLVGRKAHGLPTELDIDRGTFDDWLRRDKALGNAIVPQCAAKVLGEWLHKAWQSRSSTPG